MPMPKGIERCGIKFLGDGYLVIAYPEAEVTATWNRNLVVSIPVAYYSEEWDWLDGGFIYLGTEGTEVAEEEARQWWSGQTSAGSLTRLVA